MPPRRPPGRPPTHNSGMDLNAAIMAMTQMATAVAQQTAAQEQRDLDRQQRDIENAASRGLVEFKKQDPPKFQGEVDPEKADYWIQDMEKIFTASGTPIARKVEYATYMLTGDAEYWWKSARGIMTAAGEEVTWESFKGKFLDKYFPQTARTKLGDDFLRLRQGAMNIGEYAAKFESMSRYFRFFETVVDENYMCHRFQEGLRFEIQDSVIPLGIRQFQQLVEKCREVEIMKDRRRNLSNKGVTSGSGGPMRHNNQNKGSAEGRNGGPTRNNNQDRGKQQSKPYNKYHEGTGQYRPMAPNPEKGNQDTKGELICFKCGGEGHYANNCDKGSVCYNCKKPGHQARNCRTQKVEPAINTIRAKDRTTQGRVFCMSGSPEAGTDN